MILEKNLKENYEKKGYCIVKKLFTEPEIKINVLKKMFVIVDFILVFFFVV